jgi:serine/threonine protein kinase
MIEAINIPGYRIVRELGRGAMATVYLAIQEKFEREVALKVMSPLLDRDPSFAMRFEREARIVAQMSHSSIVHVIDVDHHDGYHYLVMECLPGGDLKARIQAGEHGLGLALKVCVAIASALDSAHSKKIVHRDVKPANILFRQDATPVLTDFGIARPMDTNSQLTMVGTLIGTLDYMSPEQANGKDLDGRSDLYSLGAVFYEALTGSVPYPADSTASLLTQQANQPPPLLPAQFAMFQPFLDQIMAKERDNRHATGSEVIRALRMVTEIANARRPDVILKPTSPAPAAAEYAPTVLAPRAVPSSAVRPEATATVRFPGTQTQPSGVMPIPPEAHAMVTTTDATSRIDPAVMSDAQGSDVGALTLISVRPPFHTVATPASPAPEVLQAPASPKQSSRVRSVAAQFVRAPIRVAIAAGICVAAIGVYLLVATGDGASKSADAAPKKTQTPDKDFVPPQPPGAGVPSGNTNATGPDAPGSVPPKGPTAGAPTKSKDHLDAGQRPPTQGAKDPKRPPQPPKPPRRVAADAETTKLAAAQAAANLKNERDKKEADIRRWLTEAKRDIAAGHLWQPPGNSAADRYLAIEKIDSNNTQARDGLARVFNAIIQEARNEAATSDWVATNGLIQRLRVLRPDHAELPNLEALLARLATDGPTVNLASKAKQQRAEQQIKNANSRLDKVPLTYASLEGAWKDFKAAEQTAPLAPGLSQLRARFPESLATAAKIEFDRGNTSQLRRLKQLAKSNGWEYSDPTRTDQSASDQ